MTDGYKIKKVRIRQNGVEKIVYPSIPATAITLDKSSISLTTVGQTSQITATLTPADSTSTVSWSSSNTSIATVSSTGLVTCVTPGTCTITATTNNGLTATCSVANQWTPGANTLFYLPLKNNISDASGHVSTSGGGSVSYQNPGAYIPKGLTISYTTNPTSFTYMGYFKAPNSSSYAILGFKGEVAGSGYYGWDLYYNADSSNQVRAEFLKYRTSNVWKQSYNLSSTTTWHHICLVNDSSNTGYLYVDGVLAMTHSIYGYTTHTNPIYVASDGGTNRPIYAGDIIMEDKAWTAQEVANYYNQTKADYGL